jgi:hypothetical protein
MGVNDIEAVSLSVEVVGVTRFKFFFQIKRRLRIVLTCDGQHRLQETIDLGVSRSEQLHLMSAPGKVLAEIENNPLRPPMGFRWYGKIDAGDLSDLHTEANHSNDSPP